MKREESSVRTTGSDFSLHTVPTLGRSDCVRSPFAGTVVAQGADAASA